MVAQVLSAAGDGVPVTDIYGVLVALIGMAGVLGSALIIQIFATRRAALTPPTADAPHPIAPDDNVGSLYERIGRLQANLDICLEKTKDKP